VKDRGRNEFPAKIVGATWCVAQDPQSEETEEEKPLAGKQTASSIDILKDKDRTIPSVDSTQIESVRTEAEVFSRVDTSLGKGHQENPPDDLPKKPLSKQIEEGQMPQYELQQPLKQEVKSIGNGESEITLSEELLGTYGKIGEIATGFIDTFVNVRNPKIEFVKGTPGMTGTPGMEVVGDPSTSNELATPEDHALKVSGDVSLLGQKSVRLEYADFFHYKKKPECSFKFLFAKPLGLGGFLGDIPILGRLQIPEPVLIICTVSTLYDPTLDSGINQGINLFGNIYLEDNPDKIIRFISGFLQVKNLAIHAAIDTSKKPYPMILEAAIQWNVTLIDVPNFKLKLTRTDLGLEVKGTPPEPSFQLSNDLVVSMREKIFNPSAKETHLIFTGGIKLEAESITGSFTMNGTGRHPEGELTGTLQNTCEWKEPFGIPGITIRQMAVQLGLTYAASWIDNIGIHGVLKVGDIDGAISILVDANDADQFVLAGTVNRITLLEILSAMNPATFVGYQALPDSITGPLEKVVDVRLEYVKLNIVPSACSIGQVHFRDEGITFLPRNARGLGMARLGQNHRRYL